MVVVIVAAVVVVVVVIVVVVVVVVTNVYIVSVLGKTKNVSTVGRAMSVKISWDVTRARRGKRRS